MALKGGRIFLKRIEVPNIVISLFKKNNGRGE
ncbi:hypothetical protein IGJ93_001533 [Enterococcus sp. DIV0174]